MLIGFCIAGLAGSPASWKPAWKVVMLLQTLRTHLACSTGYPPFCDAMTLLASPSYHRLPPGLISIWMSCPLDVLQLWANSFASSFLDLLASKLLACSGDYLATHVVAKQLCRQGPGAWAGHQPRSVSKSFLCERIPSGKGEGRCANMISSLGWAFQFTALMQASHGTLYLFAVCSLLACWQMHSVCVWGHSREDQQLVDLNHTRQGSPPLCNISVAWGEIAQYKLCMLQRRHYYWFAQLHCQAVGELGFLEVFMGEVTIWNLVFHQISAPGS